MNIYILNLPYKRPIIRKYSCSFYANGFLYPPVELIRTANIIQKYSLTAHNIKIFDAIASYASLKKCIRNIQNFSADIIITLTSVDFINEEYDAIRTIKEQTGSKIVCLGYLPDMFPDTFNNADICLGNNFETVFMLACSEYAGQIPEGLIDTLKKHKKNKPEFNPDLLDKIDFSLLNTKPYREFKTRGKTAFTYFSFGCPYQCSFCIRTYNLNKVYARKEQHIFSELHLAHQKGISNIRILDDNIPVKKTFLIALRDFLKSNNIQLRFYGLSRIDNLDEETILLLNEIGFHRILIGLETINREMQAEYNKNTSIELPEIEKRIRLLHHHKIEIVAFILVNPLKEGKKDIEKNLKFLKKLPVDYASISHIIPYPGTVFFTKNINSINFRLHPSYESSLKASNFQHAKFSEIKFFLSFYVFNKFHFFRVLMWMIQYPADSFRIFLNFFRFIKNSREERKDFF